MRLDVRLRRRQQKLLPREGSSRRKHGGREAETGAGHRGGGDGDRGTGEEGRWSGGAGELQWEVAVLPRVTAGETPPQRKGLGVVTTLTARWAGGGDGLEREGGREC